MSLLIEDFLTFDKIEKKKKKTPKLSLYIIGWFYDMSTLVESFNTEVIANSCMVLSNSNLYAIIFSSNYS